MHLISSAGTGYLASGGRNSVGRICHGVTQLTVLVALLVALLG